MFTLNALVKWRAEQHPTAIALVDDRGDRVSYAELEARSLAEAGQWLARGVGPGDVVALLDTNSVAFFVQLLALDRIRAIPALMNWRLTPAENSGLFELIGPVAVAVSQGLVDRLPGNTTGVTVMIDTEPLTDLDADRPGLPLGPQPSEVCALAFSSGTTGRAKAIPWRHEALARATMVDGFGIAGLELGAPCLIAAPVFHLAGLSNTLMCLARGAEVHLRSSFDPDATLDDIERLGIRYTTVVPAMFRAMVQAAPGRATAPDTSSIAEISYGASPISPDLLSEVRALFPSAGLRQFYGMTEVGGALTSLMPHDHDHPDRVTSAGRPNPGFEVKLVDADGAEVPEGTPGQIMVRSESLMHGYWDDPEGTAEVMIDGWFATGDIAISHEGYLTVMDRAKDMVVSGGENVYPAEVEAAIDAHPAVRDVAVIGVPDDALGEHVHAVVVTDRQMALDLEELQTFCRQTLAGYKLPRSLELVEELPRNASGKVLKTELRASHWEHRIRAV